MSVGAIGCRFRQVVAETKLAVMQSYTVNEINPQTTVDELKAFVDERVSSHKVMADVKIRNKHIIYS